MEGWEDEFIFFGFWQDRKWAALKAFPKQFLGCTLILYGKAIKLRRFNREAANILYLPEKMVKKDYMCFKHKPPQLSCLVQVC
jgi:hypothetical protein